LHYFAPDKKNNLLDIQNLRYIGIFMPKGVRERARARAGEREKDKEKKKEKERKKE
jgi:hypothetical protein